MQFYERHPYQQTRNELHSRQHYGYRAWRRLSSCEQAKQERSARDANERFTDQATNAVVEKRASSKSTSRRRILRHYHHQDHKVKSQRVEYTRWNSDEHGVSTAVFAFARCFTPTLINVQRRKQTRSATARRSTDTLSRQRSLAPIRKETYALKDHGEW